jgi:hypothetical protein
MLGEDPFTLRSRERRETHGKMTPKLNNRQTPRVKSQETQDEISRRDCGGGDPQQATLMVELR